MPDLTKLKRKSRLTEIEAPPTDTRGLLNQPEFAPAPPEKKPEVMWADKRAEYAPGEGNTVLRAKLPDGRNLRKTGRVVQFATRVTEDFKIQLHSVADKTGLTYVEVLEKALDAYEQTLDGKRSN